MSFLGLLIGTQNRIVYCIICKLYDFVDYSLIVLLIKNLSFFSIISHAVFEKLALYFLFFKPILLVMALFFELGHMLICHHKCLERYLS